MDNTPTSPQLKPLTLADMLDKTFVLFKKRWKPLVILSLIMSVPAALLGFLISAVTGDVAPATSTSPTGFFDQASNGAAVAGGLVNFIVSVFLLVVFYPLIEGAFTRVIAAEFLGRPNIDAKLSLKQMLTVWPSLIGARVLALLAVAIAGIPVIIGVVVVAASAVSGNAALVLVGVLLAIAFALPIFAMYLLTILALPLVAIEEVNPWVAIKRSFALIKKRFWVYLGTVVLIGIVATILQMLLMLIPVILSAITFNIVVLSAFFQGIGVVLGALVVEPVIAIVLALIYFDARIRFEGLDLQLAGNEISSSTETRGEVDQSRDAGNSDPQF
jgi:hypothetical protein